jgi:hypothetical protein
LINSEEGASMFNKKREVVINDWREERANSVYEEWERAKKEHEAALDMFNNATEPFWIDVANANLNIARAKMDVAKVILDREHVKNR